MAMSEWEKRVTVTNIKPKPCPFCGKRVKLRYYEVDEPFTFTDCGFKITCLHCGIGFSRHLRCMPGFDKEAEEEAKNWLIETWNTRK